ncbi:MAG: CDP-glycerol glycerophosphotransferase family protein [Actinomycetia bacterium]|nr:CDP-glycerol glycerophosphotransferase family protein [Actinomycetes bacterium]
MNVRRRVFWRIVSWGTRALYRTFSLFPRRFQVAFLSRRDAEPTLDFRLLADALQRRLPGVRVRYACYRDSDVADAEKTIIRYEGTLAQIWLAATSQVCVLDGYTPAVSIPHKREFPVTVQIWHALGTVKKFGWQSVGTPAGRTRDQAEELRMHRNYDLVVAGGPGTRQAYAEAFDVPLDHVEAIGLPRIDYLLATDGLAAELREAGRRSVLARYPELAGERLTIVYAPTFRKHDGLCSPLPGFVDTLVGTLPADVYDVVVAWHPADENGGAPYPSGGVTFVRGTRNVDLLGVADYVITDYSSVAWEAALLRKRVLFYVPDIDDYRTSPGLNVDPEAEFGSICFRRPEDVAAFIERDRRGDVYAASGFWDFAADYLGDVDGRCSERIADRVAELVAAEFRRGQGRSNVDGTGKYASRNLAMAR